MSEKTPCEYLRLHLSIKELRHLCDALDVDYRDHHSVSDLITKIRDERPDLMRGRTWTLLRRMLRDLDLSNQWGMYELKRSLFPFAYSTAEVELFGWQR